MLKTSSLRFLNSCNCPGGIMLTVKERQHSRFTRLHAKGKPINTPRSPAVEKLRGCTLRVSFTSNFCPGCYTEALSDNIQNFR